MRCAKKGRERPWDTADSTDDSSDHSTDDNSDEVGPERLHHDADQRQPEQRRPILCRHDRPESPFARANAGAGQHDSRSDQRGPQCPTAPRRFGQIICRPRRERFGDNGCFGRHTVGLKSEDDGIKKTPEQFPTPR